MFNRSQRIEFRITALAVLALFIAQMGAIAHAYSHQPSTQTSTDQQSQSSHELCGNCLNFAPLLSAAGTPAAPPFALPNAAESRQTTALSASFLDHQTCLAFRSRAPPVAR